jgi:hypothetical protein
VALARWQLPDPPPSSGQTGRIANDGEYYTLSAGQDAPGAYEWRLLRAAPVEPIERSVAPSYVAALGLDASESQMNQDDKETHLIAALIKRFGSILCVLLALIGALIGAIYWDIRSDISAISTAADRIAVSQDGIRGEITSTRVAFSDKMAK